jgi:hypothetical protein
MSTENPNADLFTVNLAMVEKLDITDLDGWKAFVRARDAFQPPRVVTRAEYEALSARERVRYDFIRRMAMYNLPKQQTPMTTAVQAQVQQVLRANMLKREPGVRGGVFISADGAVGKSTLMREIAANFEAELEVMREVLPNFVQHGDRWVPVAWVTVPPKLSIRSLAEAILAFYGEPFRTRSTESQLTKAVEAVIKDCATRLLVLDDITRYRDTEADRYASDWIRNLMETSVTVVAMGVDVQGSGILYDGKLAHDQRLGTQTRRRFTLLDLEPFSYDTTDDVRDWIAHLQALEQGLPLLDKTDGMLSTELPEYLFQRTNGVIGVLHDWIQLAAEALIGRPPAEGGETLTREDLDRTQPKGQPTARAHTPSATSTSGVAKKKAGTRKPRSRNTVFDQPNRDRDTSRKGAA